MQKHLGFVIFIFWIVLPFLSNAQIITIPDSNFKAALINIGVDLDMDGEIQQSEALSISSLNLYAQNISSLIGIKAFTNLEYLDCSFNLLPNLDLSGLSTLKVLHCEYNGLIILDLTDLVNLNDLNCSHNYLPGLNISTLVNLQNLDCERNFISSLNFTGLINLISINISINKHTNLELSGLINLQDLKCYENNLISLDVSRLTNLKSLSCYRNLITVLDVSNLIKLQYLDCYENKITNLDVSSLTNLERLECSNNSITILDVSMLINLRFLYCSINKISSLNVSRLTKLINLSCYSNLLTSLDVSGMKYLQDFSCHDNQITSLDVSGLIFLNGLWCSHNKLSSLDVSTLIRLRGLFCDENNLKFLSIKNGQKESQLSFSSNPLQYICCDEEQLIDVQNLAIKSHLVNCSVNTYCSFNPGGINYQLQGINKWDAGNNGCDSLDLIVPFLKFVISDGTNAGSIISDLSGQYNLPVKAGTYTLTPTLENPSFFSVSPDSLQVIFPNSPSPFIQDFCISPIGIHADVEIKIIPVTSARPGFDAQYKIVYHNKGNTRLSGKIQFDYNEDLMDFVNANTTTFSQNPGSLVWNYTDLDPFQSANIIITMNINSPAEIPPVNAGDALNFSASIEPVTNDELPLDNLFTLHQTVVGSKDPNDKTCLQGNFLTPNMVGNYMDYIIRFENTGTAEAINIVVKDIIDTSKFDIGSLIPIDASHIFRTIISEGNKVEFIFENIDLPFSGDGRYGYVAFKIRTKSNLNIGDKLKNTANIYFDYNLPISTNQTETTIKQIVKTEDESNGKSEISISPNPTDKFIYFQCSEKINQLEIFDTGSRLIETHISPSEKIDVGQLPAGLYWIIVHSERGITLKKFAKN